MLLLWKGADIRFSWFEFVIFCIVIVVNNMLDLIMIGSVSAKNDTLHILEIYESQHDFLSSLE